MIFGIYFFNSGNCFCFRNGLSSKHTFLPDNKNTFCKINLFNYSQLVFLKFGTQFVFLFKLFFLYFSFWECELSAHIRWIIIFDLLFVFMVTSFFMWCCYFHNVNTDRQSIAQWFYAIILWFIMIHDAYIGGTNNR